MPSPERELVLGTAGHIDHGKTALVEALTGTNTDRLAEERRRGISIELGFARLGLPGGRSVGVVDVPGHRRLVRAMVAGASGIDMFLLVVAADDGVMPQTREHWTALRALGIERGVVALTKVDVAAPEAIALATEEVTELAPGAPLARVSSRTGEGLDELLATLARVADAAAAEPRSMAEGPGVMHLDRVFSLRGIGTVVTGTLRRGMLAAGESVRVLPIDRIARIRSVQVHDRPVGLAVAGQRVALNLVGVGRRQVGRGDVVASPSASVGLSYRLDVLLDHGGERAGERVQVHAGTRQAPGRLVPLGDDFAQIRLEAPLVAEPADRVVIRRIAPPDTLGGGVVLDPAPRRHGPGAATDRLRALVAASAEEVVGSALADAPGGLPADPAAWGEVPVLGYILARFGAPRLRETVAGLVDAGKATVRGATLVPASAAEQVAEPRDAPALGPVAVRVLRELNADGLQPRGAAALADSLGRPREEVEEALSALAATGHVVALRGGVTYPRERLDRIGELVAGLAAERGSIGLAELRDALRISRKYSQAILEQLDATGVTVRHGDRHVLRRPAETAAPSSG